MKNLTSAQRWQLTLLPFLIILFCWVSWNNFFSQSESDLELLIDRPSSSTSVVSKWEYGKIAAALQSNPFEPIRSQITSLANGKISTQSDDNRQPAATSSSQDATSPIVTNTLEASSELATQPVKLLIRQKNKEVAIIGDQVYRSGQVLENGRKIESIDLNRIKLAPSTAESR